MDRFEFLSDGWLDALARVAQRLFEEGGVVPAGPVSYAEIFTDIPDEMKGGTPIGYVLTFTDGKATVARAVRQDEPADCVVRIAYGVALATMQVRSGPELIALGKQAFQDGSMTMAGSAKDLPIDMNRLHDALIEQTVTPDL